MLKNRSVHSVMNWFMDFKYLLPLFKCSAKYSWVFPSSLHVLIVQDLWDLHFSYLNIASTNLRSSPSSSRWSWTSSCYFGKFCLAKKRFPLQFQDSMGFFPLWQGCECLVLRHKILLELYREGVKPDVNRNEISWPLIWLALTFLWLLKQKKNNI